MKKYKKMFHICLTLLFCFAFVSAVNAESEKGGKYRAPSGSLSKTAKSGKNGDSYALSVNNIWMPMNNRGVVADVNINNEKSAKFADNDFLFSGGFFLSGYANGQLWANAVASASLVENFVPGTVEGGQADPKAVMYVLKSEDPPFSDSWDDWKDAVDLGADFYDGNGDGVYNPVDLNGNGVWDPEEDKPDLIGDETVWCVYNDGQPLAQRTRYAGIRPMGIEVRQTVFGFASKGAIGNILFLRYRIKNTGLVADTLKDVYFGAWADPDLGDHMDDLVGVDTTLNAGFVYQATTDALYGPNPPCFMIDFFSGPKAYIPGVSYNDINGNGIYDGGDTDIDTAFSVRGQTLGITEYPGATNLGVASFVHYQQSDPVLGDPDTHFEARNYMLGFDKEGNPIDPCDWALGTVVDVNCEDVNNRFWYSGDPVGTDSTSSSGWLNNTPTDQRQMQNTGPFELVKDEELEIVVAYIVGQGSSPLNSVAVARKISGGAQFVFDNNFRSPSPGPAIKPTVKTGEDFIDLMWTTHEQVNFANTTDLYDLSLKGFTVTAYKTNNTQDLVELQRNSTVIATYDLDNYIKGLYQQTGQGGFELVFNISDTRLDPEIYADSLEGEIRLRITEDPFTGQRLVKGKPYHFAITGLYYNKMALRYKPAPTDLDSIGNEGDYFLTSEALVGVSENIPKITRVYFGDNMYDPPLAIYEAEKTEGFADANMQIDVYDKTLLTGDDYKVTFKIDSTSEEYSPMWKLENTTTGTVLLDSVKEYLFDNTDVSIPSLEKEGFIVKLSTETPTINLVEGEAETDWYDSDWTQSYYVQQSLPQSSTPTEIPSIQKATTLLADQLRRIELRFDGTGGKAYRYLNGFIKFGLPATKKLTYMYAEAITSADTVGNGAVGNWNVAEDHANGFVDVPFTAWIDDPVLGETRQLSVGIIETSVAEKGFPDGTWNSDTTNLKVSKEFIVIFDYDYDPEGNNAPILKGGHYVSDDAKWADLRGYSLDPAITISDEDIAIAKSPYFNAHYVLGIRKRTMEGTPSTGDKFVFPVTNYPYTPNDVFTFTTRDEGFLTEEENKTLWDKVNVYPNPLFGYNVATSYDKNSPDEPFVTFSNLPPDEITIKIYSLSGIHLRTLNDEDRLSSGGPNIRWNLQNESGLRVASGMYLAIVSSKEYGDKVLKFAIVMPQKQIPKY